MPDRVLSNYRVTVILLYICVLLLIPRLLNQLNEKEKEYQELVTNSLRNVQGAIDTLKMKNALDNSGKYIYLHINFLSFRFNE